MKLGLFGRPVSHSRSPRIFSRLSRLLKTPIRYEAVEIAPDGLRAAIACARDDGWAGASVTVPLKEEALAASGTLTPAARAIGAVNCLKFGKVVTGHNTDGEGLRDAMRRAGVTARNKSILIFGAGGAAKAAAWAVARNGAKSVRIHGRTASRAKRLARELAEQFPATAFSAGAPAPADIWINSTPLGMKGFSDRSPAPRSLRSPSFAVDLVYGRRTAFQRDAAARGARVSDGAAMLVFQALRAWEFWNRPLGAAKRAQLAEPLIQEVLR